MYKAHRQFWCSCFISTALIMLSGSAIAENNGCTLQQSALNNIGEKYKPTFQEYEKEGKNIKKENVSLKAKVSWKNVDIRFGLPTVSIRDQTFILGLPQVTMKLKDIIFSTLSFRMEIHQTGEYPEFTCDHSFIPKCTVHWSPILTKVTVPFMQKQHIKMDIPEFTFSNTKIIMGVPEFTIKQQHWIVGLPQFRLDSFYLNSGKIKKQGEELKSKIGTTRSEMASETVEDIHALFNCQREGIIRERKSAQEKFSSGLAVLDAVIKNIRSQGGDPTKMVDGSNLVAQRAKLMQRRRAILEKFNNALAKLDQSEKKAVASLGGSKKKTTSESASSKTSKMQMQSLGSNKGPVFTPKQGGLVRISTW